MHSVPLHIKEKSTTENRNNFYRMLRMKFLLVNLIILITASSALAFCLLEEKKTHNYFLHQNNKI